MTYASGTDVTVDRSQQELVKILHRYGVETYQFGATPGKASIFFEVNTLPVLISIPVPSRPLHPKMKNPTTGRMVDAMSRWDQEVREAWRACVLLVKANLEAVERGIVSVEQAFMAYLVGDDGKTTLGDVVLPQYLKAHRERLAIEK